jgi:hypothetical protein
MSDLEYLSEQLVVPEPEQSNFITAITVTQKKTRKPRQKKMVTVTENTGEPSDAPIDSPETVVENTKAPRKKRINKKGGGEVLVVEKFTYVSIDAFCENIRTNFQKCVRGYHLVNSTAISEKVWEDINEMIFKSSGISIFSKSNGGHESGMDIHSNIGRLSNKSAKYSNSRTNIDISSYRLSSVCSDRTCGTPEEFISEINRRKNFDYYSVIAREESPDGLEIYYDWLLIPASYPALDPSTYEWTQTLGKRGKNKDQSVGWHTNKINGSEMSVSFSMSSQLWLHLEITEDMKQFIIASTVEKATPRMNYIVLSDMMAD